MFSENKLEALVEAYKTVCALSNPYKTYSILNKIEDTGLDVKSADLKGIMPSKYLSAAKAYLCQIILRSNRRKVNPLVMQWAAGQAVVEASVPYPAVWRKILINEGLSLSTYKCGVAFLYSQLIAWGRFFWTFKNHIKMSLNSYEISSDNNVMFLGLLNGAIPLPERQFQSSTVVDWFKREGRIAEDERIIIQTNTIHKNIIQDDCIISPYVLPKLSRIERVYFLRQAIQIFFCAFISWCFGNWKSPFLATAGLDIAYMNQLTNLPKSFYISNSDYAIRPFWSYVAEERHCGIYLYFYSANINCFYQGQVEDSPPPPGYKLMSWPNYMVLDSDQKVFLERPCRISKHIEVVGSLDYSDSDDKLPDIPERSLALFDISPFNYNVVASMALIAPYYTSDILSNFLSDIVDCTKELDIALVWKRKREVVKETMSRNYTDIVDSMQKDSHVIIVPPGIAARRVLQYVGAAISIPFTSTAILAKEIGVKSAFYEPTGNVRFLNGLSRGLPVFYSKENLRQWLQEVYKIG